MADEGGILSKVSLPSLTQVETVDYDHPAHIPACPVSGCAKGLFCEQICYGALLYTSAQGLLSDALVGSFDRPVILDSFIFVVSLVLLRQTFAKVNYAKLDGLEVNSLARDAGDWALAGEVPLTSKDGKYQVATFAGGCFWGTELHFQRMPGVIATCVGYLAHFVPAFVRAFVQTHASAMPAMHVRCRPHACKRAHIYPARSVRTSTRADHLRHHVRSQT